jgi:hypothetical protein
MACRLARRVNHLSLVLLPFGQTQIEVECSLAALILVQSIRKIPIKQGQATYIEIEKNKLTINKLVEILCRFASSRFALSRR